MLDQLIIEDKYSLDDYDASLSARKISQPKKKSVKETLPYSNKTYDFSAINGELYWEERELEYEFEITASNPEELENKKLAFASWVMNVQEAKIYDPYIFGYHFVGTYDDMEFEDDESLEKTTVVVRFAAYPYKIANVAKKYNFTIKYGATITAIIINESDHRVVPKLMTSGETVFKIGNLSYAVPAGEITDDALMFTPGTTEFSIQNSAEGECTVEISFFEEVF